MVDISRATTGVSIPASVQAEVVKAAVKTSAVASLAKKIDLPGSGVSINYVTSAPVANWVNETAKKPVSTGGVETKTITPYKIAVIVPFSMEFRRDANALYAALVEDLPGALATKFDNTVFGVTGNTVPGSNFDTLSSAAVTALGGSAKQWVALTDAYQKVALAGGKVTGWALSTQASGLLITAVKADGSPLFLQSISDTAIPSILGAPVVEAASTFNTGTPNVIGYAGDWTTARYGTVEGVQIAISDQATVGAINLWEQNMFAVRAEIEVGFRVDNIARFTKLTDAAHA